MLDLTGKIVMAHRGFYNANCRKFFRENSVEVCRVSGQKEYIQIIELDLRKSQDEVLYCYHGNFWQYYFALRIPRKFAAIRKKYGADSLKAILEVIPQKKAVFLDIKDTRITRRDILDAFQGRKFKEVILGNKSVSFLDRFEAMPTNFVKVLNGNVFCAFYNLLKLKRKNFKYFEVVFPFQIRRKLMEKVAKVGLEFNVAGLFFLSQKHYSKAMNKMRYIGSDFVDID